MNDDKREVFINTDFKKQDIFNAFNPYGYRLNLNNPKIKELYYRYKKYIGVARNIPLSDEQRREFEAYVLGEMPPRQG